MVPDNVDILTIKRGMVIAPAGCGKTELIATAAQSYRGSKPLLILTHTNAGVSALQQRLPRGTKASSFRLHTLDAWALRLVSSFPLRSDFECRRTLHPSTLHDYDDIRRTALRLVSSSHLDQVLIASYESVFVDEYQDCTEIQHRMVAALSKLLPTCVMADPLQSLFGFAGDVMPDWDDVLQAFPVAAKLETPWRWKKAHSEDLGSWLLGTRQPLESGQPIDLREAPSNRVKWVRLSGSATADMNAIRNACFTRSPDAQGTVLIIGESSNAKGRALLAKQVKGATVIEPSDQPDAIAFANALDLADPSALGRVLQFASDVMTGVGASTLLPRLTVLRQGRPKNPPNAVEASALQFLNEPSYRNVLHLLTTLREGIDVNVYRRRLLQTCLDALQSHCADETISFGQCVAGAIEHSRRVPRALPGRSVGSTLLLKGLECSVAVITSGDTLDHRNLYVALTRATQRVVICSRQPVLPAVKARRR